MEEKFELCCVKLSSSYEMSLVIIKEFETESLIKGYHAYMNDWIPILGKILSTCPEPENKIDKYAVAVTKDTQVIGHLKKGKTGLYTKTVFYFLQANKMNTASINVTGEMEMDKACKFPAQFYSKEKKNILDDHDDPFKGMVGDAEDDSVVDELEFDLNQLCEAKPDLVPENLDADGLVYLDREVASTNLDHCLLTKLLTNAFHNLLKPLEMAAVTRMRFPTKSYHHHHEMKLTSQLKS